MISDSPIESENSSSLDPSLNAQTLFYDQGKGLVFKMLSSFYNCIKGKLATCNQFCLKYSYDDTGWGLWPNFSHKYLMSGQSWNRGLSSPLFLLLGDDGLVILTKVSTRESGKKSKSGCLWA